jgi:hypothetical protein
MAIRNQLGEIKKHDLTAEAFYNKVKTLADTLSSIGQLLRDSEFTGFILNGLDKDYDSLIENVTGREIPISPQDLLGRLLSTEQRVEARKSAGVYDTVDHSANASYRGGGGQRSSTRPPPGGRRHLRAARLPRPPSTTRMAGIDLGVAPPVGLSSPANFAVLTVILPHAIIVVLSVTFLVLGIMAKAMNVRLP